MYTGITCNTARSPSTGTDSCAIIGVNTLTPGASGLAVYPNPSNGIFSVNFNANTKDNYQVIVTNTLGEMVYKEMLNGFTGQFLKKIDIAEFGKGVYMVSVTNSGNETVRKVMIY